MSREPDAAFHDIGKLINWEAIGLRGTDSNGRKEPDPHEFQRCVAEDWSSNEWGVDPEAAPWRSILTWHPRWFERFTGSKHRWHAKAADWLISGYGRALDERQVRGAPREGLYCLWTGEQHGDPRLKSAEDLKTMISMLNSSPSWSEAAERYFDQLSSRAETARPGLNVTTLAAHCATVGKLARVLAQEDWPGFDPNANPSQKAIRAAQHPPQLITSHIKLGLRQRPFRARDLGLFQQMAGRLEKVIEAYTDNVLSRLGFECVCAFRTEQAYEAFLASLERAGFEITARTLNATLKDYLGEPQPGQEEAETSGLMKVTRLNWRKVYVAAPPPRIDLPLCEGCQMTQATKHWPKDHLAQMTGWHDKTKRALRKDWREIEGAEVDPDDRPKLESWLAEWGEEDLCDQCFEIRRETEPIPLLRDGKGDVLYLRLSLSMDRLESALVHLHKQYLLASHPDLAPDVLGRLFVSFPLIVDFLRNYVAFLSRVRTAIEKSREGRYAALDESLLAIIIERDAEVFEILDVVSQQFAEAFPKLLGLPDGIPNPIGIALSLSPAKHPFFDHWRFLQDPMPDISIQCVGSGRAAFHLADYAKIKEAIERPKRSQIHRLASAAAVSPTLGQLVLKERDDQAELMLDKLAGLVPGKLDFQSARILANLIGG